MVTAKAKSKTTRTITVPKRAAPAPEKSPVEEMGAEDESPSDARQSKDKATPQPKGGR